MSICGPPTCMVFAYQTSRINRRSREAAFLRDFKERSICVPIIFTRREELPVLQRVAALSHPEDVEEEGLGNERVFHTG
jgi:hypothetical protein